MTGTQQTFHNMKYYGILSAKTKLLIIIQIQSFEKVHLSVVGCCCRCSCYSILTSGSKKCYYSPKSINNWVRGQKCCMNGTLVRRS